MNNSTPSANERTNVNGQKYLTVDELADILGINLNAAYSLVKQPGFPAIRISPRRIIIIADSLDNWMREHATGA